jgi:hypothetical protein
MAKAARNVVEVARFESQHREVVWKKQNSEHTIYVREHGEPNLRIYMRSDAYNPYERVYEAFCRLVDEETRIINSLEKRPG